LEILSVSRRTTSSIDMPNQRCAVIAQLLG
jgi:hypothetical protein